MKIKEFQKALREKNINFALFYNFDPTIIESNIIYFSGYAGTGILAISKNKKPFLLVSKMEFETAKNSKLRVYKFKKKKVFGQLASIIKKRKINKKKIAIDKNIVTLNTYKALKKNFKKSKFYDISKICSEFRYIKTKKEVKKIKQACKITDNILKKCFKDFRFKKESEIAAFLEYETKKCGCELAFRPIVASGSNASQPHYTSGNVKLKKGFCVIDFGVRYKGYCSDITRTVFIGKPLKKDLYLYNFLLNIQKNAISLVKTNSKCKDLYNKTKKELGKYSKYFIHGLGHGIGVKLHELPNLTEKSKDKFKKNMVFTIEPGIYFSKKLGIRIEDDILLTKNRPVILSKTPKKLMVFRRG